jgi:hypothetical protein
VTLNPNNNPPVRIKINPKTSQIKNIRTNIKTQYITLLSLKNIIFLLTLVSINSSLIHKVLLPKLIQLNKAIINTKTQGTNTKARTPSENILATSTMDPFGFFLKKSDSVVRVPSII